MKDIIKRMPILGSIFRKIYKVLHKQKPFPGSEAYWIQRYKKGGWSGAGSYHKLAEFKAETINSFVKDNAVLTVIEYGCGDGNQLKLAEYPAYIGFDVSPTAVALCQDVFRGDKTKCFKMMADYKGETAHLTLSLDVIYHLIEDETYYFYMKRLFNSSKRFVVIYSSNKDEKTKVTHVKHRLFSEWIDVNISGWKLSRKIPNRFPGSGGDGESSFCDFYIYEKIE